MQNTQTTLLKCMLSAILCIVLITAMALFTSGCGTAYNSYRSSSETPGITETEYKEIGEGDTEFRFTVTDQNGEETGYLVHTDKTTVGEALLELELIEGEAGDYGLYVKTVDGTTLDYDTDGKYWAFYVDGEYAVSGVDLTDIKPGVTYSFKAQ